MHIEINSGGLFGGASINDFQFDLNKFIGTSNDILSAFKTVQNTTQNLNGGVGVLRDALEQIGERIREEERKIEAAIEVQQKTIEFVSLVNRVDKQVADLVTQNSDEFYRTYPWLRPPVPVEDNRNFIQKGLDYAGEKLHQAGEALKEFWEGAKDGFRQLGEFITEFYEDHKKLIDTIVLGAAIIGSIAALISGAGVIALVPLLQSVGVPLGIATGVSAAVVITSEVLTIGSSTLDLADTWFEIDNPVFNTIQNYLNVTSTIFGGVLLIGGIHNFRHPDQLADVKKKISDPYKALHLRRTRGIGCFDKNGRPVECVADSFPGQDKGFSGHIPYGEGEYYHVKPEHGGEVYVSTGPIDHKDFQVQINNYKDVAILSGVDGFEDGTVKKHIWFYIEDKIHNIFNKNVTVYNFNKLTVPQITEIMQKHTAIVGGFCFSERNKAIIEALKRLK